MMRTLARAVWAAVMVTVALGAVIAMQPRPGAELPLAGGAIQPIQQSQDTRVIIEIASEAPLPDFRDATVAVDLARSRASAAQERFLVSHGADGETIRRWSLRRIDLFPMLALTVTPGELAQLRRNPIVKAVWPDRLIQPAADLTLTQMGLLPNAGDPGAWAEGADGTNMIVAVLDTGVDKAHPFLAGKVIEEACFSTTNAADRTTSLCPGGAATLVGDGAAAPCSLFAPFLDELSRGCGHGTMVAGVAAGKNPAGVSPLGGVAKEARILAVQIYSKVDNPNGGTICGFGQASCARAYTSDILAGMAHVVARAPAYAGRIAAVNVSGWSGLFAEPDRTHDVICNGHPLKVGIDALRAQNIPTVLPAGDSQQRDRTTTPGCIETAVIVGASDHQGAVWFSSNMGPAVDLMAPIGDMPAPRPNGTFTGVVTTSVTSAAVAGSFAAVKSRVPTATVDQIEQALKNTGATIVDRRAADPGQGLPAGSLSRPQVRVNLATRAVLGTLGPLLDITAAQPVSLRGPSGGPFASTTDTITVRNAGDAAMTWTAAFDSAQPPGATRFDLSSASGTLAPFTSTTITVTVAASAVSSPDGFYSDRIRFVAGSQEKLAFVSLHVTSQPVNDDRADAIALGASGTTTGMTTFATRELASGPNDIDEPPHFPGTTGNKSIWWTWRAPADGQAVFSTAGSSFDTVLAIYGPAGDAKSRTPVRNDDNGAGSGHSRAAFHAESSTTYVIAVDGRTPSDHGAVNLSWSFVPDQGTPTLVSAILPGSRSIGIGQTATAFGTVINTGPAATKCYLQPSIFGTYRGEFDFRVVTPDNAIDPAFAVNEGVDVPAGGIRSFVFAITPRLINPGVSVKVLFDCENTRPAPETNGVNSFVLTATTPPGPDMIPIAVTLSGDGIVNIPGNTGTGLFAASVINIGAAAPITVSADVGGFPLGVDVTVCETNPATGVCLAPAAAAQTRAFATNDIATYVVFARGTQEVPFNPGAHRVVLRFKDAQGGLRGLTSVAVRTQ